MTQVASAVEQLLIGELAGEATVYDDPVGLELVITRIEAKLKLSQNRPAADIEGVLTGLEQIGDAASAAAVAAATEHDRQGA